MNKPILCLDFDGVLHSYISGWKGAAVIPDPPVDGAIAALQRYLEMFTVCVHSSRFNATNDVLEAMKAVTRWLRENGLPESIPVYSAMVSRPVEDAITLVSTKPSAMVTLDDRAITFNGVWPEPGTLLAFRPWNKPEV